jgi:hypothetical protein
MNGSQSRMIESSNAGAHRSMQIYKIDSVCSDERRSTCLPTRRSSVLFFHYCTVCIMSSSGPYRDAEESAVGKGVRHDDDDCDDDQSDSGNFAPIASAEIATVLGWLQNLNLQPGTVLYPTNTNNHTNTNMTPERLQYIIIRLLQQQCGYLYASVNTTLYHEWVPYSADDFTSLMRDPALYNHDDDGSSCSSLQENGGIDDYDEDGLAFVPPAVGGSTFHDDAALRRNKNNERSKSTAVVLDIYRTTRTAALDDDNFVADATTPMKARGCRPARLLSNDVALITHDGAAHLIPPTGRAGRADTWFYIAAAVLGLGNIVIDDPDDEDAISAILLKALRGCWKSAESTLPNTGLNRSPTNMLKFMDHQYVWGDTSSCLLILPILTIEAAKSWTGESYEVIILCDDDRYGRANHRQVAQRIGLTTINTTANNNNSHAVVQSATSTELKRAVDLLSHILKFSAYALEQLPGPVTPRGAALWLSYRDEFEAARTLHATIVGGDNISREQYHHKIIVPVVQQSPAGQMVAKVDLGAMNNNDNDDMGRGIGGRQRGNVVVYPDPLLLAAKSSVVWTRKFAFQLLADSEPSLYDCTGQGMDHAYGGGGGNAAHNNVLDEILGKNVAFGSQNDGSPASCGDFTG